MLPACIHLIGIGGAGMAGLAQYLLASGRTVSGSDQTLTPTIERLSQDGARIWPHHSDEHLNDVDLVVVSDAIPNGNAELEGARRRGIPVMRRAECLDQLREGRCAIMVAGSHGKTTTGAMIACILSEAGLEPGFVLGADVPCLGGKRAQPGGSEVFLAEACEAFRNLDLVTPDIALITNVDDEHVNHYASQAALEASFSAFAHRARTIITSGEDSGVARLTLPDTKVTWFGLHPDCAISAQPWPAPFSPRLHGLQLDAIALAQPGDHMRRNALAAIAACHALGVAPEYMRRGLERFTGASRRWQNLGEVRGIQIVDDYAHHPTEITETLQAARAAMPHHRLVVAFQPLLHSRVQRLMDAFVTSLALADHVLLLDVDDDGEKAQSSGSATIALGLQQHGVTNVRRTDAKALINHICSDLRSGDMLLVMGGAHMAGVAESLYRKLTEAPHPTAAPAGESTASAAALLQRHWAQRVADSLRRRQNFIAQFRTRARANPTAPALLEHTSTLSYAQLDLQSDELAAGLAARGWNSHVIGVSLPLGAELIIALLGVMKAGSTYLPLDPALPKARHNYMLEQADAIAIISNDPGEGTPVVSTTMLRATGGKVPSSPRSKDGAYICFTSGSTGYPKGVLIQHSSLAALLRDTVKRFKIRPGSRMLLNTSIGFDVSLAEICGTLAGGGALATGGSRPLGGEQLKSALLKVGATHLSITPSLLASARPDGLTQLQCIIACGEPCPPELVATWGPGRLFFNVYGPTEATIYATAALCDADAEITIGHALGHVQAHVLDDALYPVAAGELGELCLSGPGVSSGYLGRPEETSRRFIYATIGRRRLRLYRTGDMVHLGNDGALRFVGRTDTQIKIHGVRIELNEIERAVLREKDVADAAVCLIKEPRPSLLCFVQPKDGHAPNLSTLSSRLAAWLPESAVPSRIQLVATIPLTPSGKKDRQKLVAEHSSRHVTRAPEYWPPTSKIEQRLAPLWQKALALNEPVGRLDHFSALGGDSLSSLILIQLIETDFQIAVPPGYFGRIGSLPQMATQLDDLQWHQGSNTGEDKGFKAGRIYRRMRDLSGHWPGKRLSPDHLVSSLGQTEAKHDLFLCCQMETEFAHLAARLAPTFRTHGMRSGHLIIDNEPGSIHQLATHYAEEITELYPDGPVLLAGVCQGGAIVRTIAQLLTAQGRMVPLLVLIEPGRPQPYVGRTALICAEDSFLNPLRSGGSGIAPYEAAMPAGVSLDLVPGIHGTACVEPAVQFLAHHLKRRVDAVLNELMIQA